MVSDIVEQLRDMPYWYTPSQGDNMRHKTAAKAADEIERLRAALEGSQKLVTEQAEDEDDD